VSAHTLTSANQRAVSAGLVLYAATVDRSMYFRELAARVLRGDHVVLYDGFRADSDDL